MPPRASSQRILATVLATAIAAVSAEQSGFEPFCRRETICEIRWHKLRREPELEQPREPKMGRLAAEPAHRNLRAIMAPVAAESVR